MMANQPLPRTNKQVVVMRGTHYNDLMARIERLENLVVTPPLILDETGPLKVLSIATSPKDSLVVVKLTGARDDGGKYDAGVGTGKMSEVAGDLEMPADYAFPDDANAIVYNPGDPPGLHLIDPNNEREKYRLGKVTGTVGSEGGDDAGKRLVTIDPFPLGVFPVYVVSDGGDGGNAENVATFTYTVTTLGGEDIATEVPLGRPRPIGKLNAYAGPGGGYGIAFYDGDDLVLWDAGEV